MLKNDFIINVSLEEHTILVSLSTSKYYDKDIIISIKDIENENEIHIDKITLSQNIYWWYRLNNIENYNGFIIEIFQKNDKVFEEKIRFKSAHGVKIKKQCLFIGDLGGMGDTAFTEPLIRKINNIFDQKIIVFTYYPQLFINHPCIDKVIKVHDFHALDEISKNVPPEYLNEDLYEIRYVMRWDRDRFGFIPHWTAMDLRQYAAFQYGITLKTDELDYYFYPNDYEEIEGMPDKYVVINPSITGGDRTWDKEKWQKLVDILNFNNINVVSLGTEDSMKSKGFFNLNIEKGLNLCGDKRQNNLSQAWHIINKSDIFISMSNGLLTLASSTDTYIIQLGGNGDPSYFNIPYRNGIQGYKYSYVEGECKIKCISDPKYTLCFFGLFGNKSSDGRSRLGSCFKNYDEYLCHSDPNLVANEVLRILRSPQTDTTKSLT